MVFPIHDVKGLWMNLRCLFPKNCYINYMSNVNYTGDLKCVWVLGGVESNKEIITSKNKELDTSNISSICLLLLEEEGRGK